MSTVDSQQPGVAGAFDPLRSLRSNIVSDRFGIFEVGS